MTISEPAKAFVYSAIAINPVTELDKIKATIEPYEVVSFDVFDTLLKRNVSSRLDVYRVSQRLYESAYGRLGFDLAPKRLQAEKKAYSAAKSEVSLVDIHTALNVSETAAIRLVAAEMEAERLLSAPSLPMREVFSWAVSEGKRIVIISDMYLPSSFVAELLEKAGYSGYEKLFVSSDYGCRKLDGGLFDIAISDMGIDAAEIVHVGDSVRPDYLSAKKAGIRPVLIAKSFSKPVLKKSTSSLAVSMAQATADNLAADGDYFYRFGVKALGPLLYGLSCFVHDVAEEHGVEKIYFMARDGYVLKKAYEKVYPSEQERSRYLYASRKSFGIPSIYSIDDLVDVGPTTRLISPASFLRSVGVPADIAENVAAAAGYSSEDGITKLECLHEDRFNEMCSLASPYALESAEECRPLLVKYLKQEGVDERSLVFDLGWAGNIQGFLNRVLKKELGCAKGVRGVYLGLDKAKCRDDIECDSYLGFDYPNLFLELVELCFSAPEGTTKGFDVAANGCIAPVLAPYEYEGHPESEAVRSIQSGALDFVSRFSRIADAAGISLSPYESFGVMRRIGTNPSDEDLLAFSGFRFEDGGSYYSLASPEPLRHYIANPKDFKADFASSRWKVGFAKKLTNIPAPYYEILLGAKRVRAAFKQRA